MTFNLEQPMRKTVLLAAAALAALACGASAFAMGGSSAPTSQPGYGSSSGSSPSSSEYSTALRLIHREQYADAIPHLQSALTQDPKNADVLNYLGYTERMVGNYTVSLIYYQQALRENPDHKGVHEYMGELYLKMNDLPSAQGQLTELTRLCPNGCDERDALTKAIAAYVPPAAAAPASSN
jgi:tetratricopeptide (TPR) repeat protein